MKHLCTVLLLAACGITSASAATISVSAWASVNSASPNTSYGTNGGQLPFVGGWEIIAEPASSYSGQQIHPGSGMLIFTGIDQMTPGTRTADVFITNVPFTATSSLTYTQVAAAGETDFGPATFTIDSTGSIVTITGSGFESALDYVFSHSGSSLSFHYPGIGGPYFYGPGVGGNSAPRLTGTLEPAVVPEPSSWTMLVMILALITVWRMRQQKDFGRRRITSSQA